MPQPPSSPPPAGFTPHFRKSRVTDPWEPIFSREIDGVLQIGLQISEAHTNSRDFLHGAVIAALADNAMGLSYGMQARAKDPDSGKAGAVTVSLNVDYAATPRLGQWLQVEPRVVKAGRSIGFVDALITADGETVARASATFRLL
jgi:uncharacterized protein (TIGR00369 family)